MWRWQEKEGEKMDSPTLTIGQDNHPFCGNDGSAEESSSARLLIVGHEDEGFVSRVSQQFHQLGWQVHPARSAGQVRHLAATLPAGIVIMPTDFADESGWLTCAKLVREHPEHRVILVGAYTTPDLQR